MKTYKEEVTVKKIVQDVFCNCCGGAAVDEERDDCVDRLWQCEIHIAWRDHGSFPGNSNGIAEYHICQKCFNEKIKPAMILPANETIHKDINMDCPRTIIRP